MLTGQRGMQNGSDAQGMRPCQYVQQCRDGIETEDATQEDELNTLRSLFKFIRIRIEMMGRTYRRQLVDTLMQQRWLLPQPARHFASEYLGFLCFCEELIGKESHGRLLNIL
jgi:hypothetical protein